MKKIGILIALLTGLLFMQACYYDNVEELYPIGDNNCDTSSVTYSNTIAIIMADNCNSCHNAGFAQGNVITDNYDDLKTIADNGRLWGAVSHDPAYSPMPQGLPQLPQCELDQIQAWINNGALND